MRYDYWTTHDTESWRALTNSFLPMDNRFRHDGLWRADLTAQQTPAYRVMHWVQRGHRFDDRRASHIRQLADDGHYWVVMPQTGFFTARHGESEISALPGQALAMGMDQACRMWVPDTDSYGIQVPRPELDRHLKPRGPLRMKLDLDSGLGRILTALVRTVHAEKDNLSDREFRALCDRMTELFCMIALKDMQPMESHLTEVAEVVRGYVRQRLGSGKLPLTAVAAALGWSPRQLRTALQRSGTTYRDLRNEETLRAARDLLQDPAYANLSIGEIAARAGLTPAWFSSTFKVHYGESPREYRRRGLAGAPE
ncbi:MAG TPA: AraC family transcriptional regulator [Kribbella sp.]|nr:AraC family transcriptional regulator [Kribbella sp.]